MSNGENDMETRQERREKKLRKKKERLPQHGKKLVGIYRDALLKRLRGRVDSNKS